KDWEEVVMFFDSPTSFTYFDPPYVTGDPGGAYRAFSAQEMQRLRARLDKMKGAWLLSCDDSPQCRSIFSGLERVEIPIKYSPGAIGAKRELSQELIILSPGLATRLKAA